MTIKVPRGMLATTVSGNQRFQEEVATLGRYFPGFTLRRSQGDIWADAAGTLRTFADKRYQIRIILGSNFPHTVPDIEPVGWRPKSNPHMYPSGNLCVMRSSQWSSFMTTAVMVAKAAIWLNKYEVWLDKRYWPGSEQHDHNMIYNLRKWWHEL
ncbi:hypothetical protein [Phytohabitans kaempferiae]|uniref:Type II CBASS E2 protein domain-containing protein n=1 Tax=Phytohabitans kaempferiae TaxID=1620943 RepID=A0ABV6MFZ6_9ACTN